MFKALLKRWRAEQDAEAHSRGYDWAAGQMLRGTTATQVETALEAQAWEPGHPFDKGVRDAVTDWRIERRWHP